MSEAETVNSMDYSNAEIEPALYDLAGAASVATIVLEAIHAKGGEPMSLSHLEGLEWLGNRLGTATEHVMAIHEKRETQWNTMMESDTIRKALDHAVKRGEVRAANFAARIALVAAENGNAA